MQSKIKAFLGIVWSDVCDTYKRVKIYLLGIAIAVAIFEWRQIKAALLLKAAQNEMKSDNKKDDKLSNLEDQENNEANELVKEAQQLPNQQQPVDENWYLNKDSK